MRLSRGEYAEGWADYEARWHRAELQTIRRMFREPWWDGSPLQGRDILLFAEQGFGDAIQFVRYAALVAAAGGRVALDCQPRLRELFSGATGVSEVIPNDERIADYDLCAPLMSLPHVLGTTIERVPADVPYLSAPPSCAEKWRWVGEDAQPRLRVGLAWASNPAMSDAWRRSVMPEALLPLAEAGNVRYYSLQIDMPEVARELAASGLDLVDTSEQQTGFADTAALIAHLDVVISVDTAVAHLAGAMAKPVWLILSRESDWRWMHERADTPWYPTMRLFRQREEGSWDDMVASLVSSLRAWKRPA